jgi:HlyD family secretion protein
VLVAQRTDALKVPASSVFRDPGWAAYVVERGRAVRRELVVGAAGADEVEILSGLAEGERVVLDPSSTVAGAAVRPRTAR